MANNMAAMSETWVRSPGQEDPLENGYPLQYSCLRNPMVTGAWQATVHRVAKSQTRLSHKHTLKVAIAENGHKAAAFLHAPHILYNFIYIVVV